jgi:hypothetical protein
LPEDDERKDERQAGGGGLDAGAGREHPFGRGRAEAVAGTEEEEVGQELLLTLIEVGTQKFFAAMPRKVPSSPGKRDPAVMPMSRSCASATSLSDAEISIL